MGSTRSRVLIAGGSSGIGLGMARAWRQRGHVVVVVGRDPTRIDASREGGIVAVRCDVTSTMEIEQVLDAHGPFDIVVFSSAVSAAPEVRFAPGMTPIAGNDVLRELAVNTGGAVLLAQQWLARRRVDEADGVFVLVGSPAGFAPATSLLYATTKGGAHTFARGLRFQLRQAGVRVVEVLPPAVDTPLNPLPIPKAAPDDVGARAVAGVMAGRDVVYVGPTWVVSLLARVWPGLAMRLVAHGSRHRPTSSSRAS
jgi:uncharacterized oxidoreductase